MISDIKDACMRNHPVVLDSAIKKTEASPYKRQLKPYLDRAYYLKQHQNEQDTYVVIQTFIRVYTNLTNLEYISFSINSYNVK